MELPERKIKYTYVFGVIAILIFIALIASQITIKKIFDTINRERGEQIAEQVEAYKIHNQNYPEKLEDLVPDYLVEIPKCNYGFFNGKFRYHTVYNTDTTYSIWFVTGMGSLWNYMSFSDEWVLGD